MTSGQLFHPDWVSAPGETIEDLLAERGIAVDEFARRMQCTSDEAQFLLEGRATVSIGVARRLVEILGASVEFWMARDHQYREDTSRRQEVERKWIRDLPLADMVRFGWIRPRRPSEELAECLSFFDVPSIVAWRQKYGGLEQAAAFRTSRTFDSHPEAVAAWLRRGEIEAAQIQTQPFDPTVLEGLLVSLRSLTWRRDPRNFLTELQSECARAGVAVVVVRAPTGCRASGAVRLLAGDKAVVHLSFRYLSDDQFWFTFYHEAGHLVLHRNRISYLESLRGDNYGILEEMDPLSDREEEEANEFAARTLIPDEFRSEFRKLAANTRDVIRFSVRAGVSPGIVVGQLQHSQRIGPNRLNRLKRRYHWDD